MRRFIKIESTDNTDVIIFVDKIQYVMQTKQGCSIGLDNGFCINSGAPFGELAKAIEKVKGGA